MPTPEASPQADQAIVSANSVPDPRTQPRPVPTPIVGLTQDAVSVPVNPSPESPKLNQNPQSGLLSFDPPRQDAIAGFRGGAQQGQNFRRDARAQGAEIVDNANKPALGTLGGVGIAKEERETAASSAQPRSNISPPGINPVNTGPVNIKLRPQTIQNEEQIPPVNPNTAAAEPESRGKPQPEKPAQ